MLKKLFTRARARVRDESGNLMLFAMVFILISTSTLTLLVASHSLDSRQQVKEIIATGELKQARIAGLITSTELYDFYTHNGEAPEALLPLTLPDSVVVERQLTPTDNGGVIVRFFVGEANVGELSFTNPLYEEIDDDAIIVHFTPDGLPVWETQ